MTLSLSCGDNLVRLAPDAGGGIAQFTNGDLEVLRSPLPDAVEARDPLGLACFPMTPFVNRIRDGRFMFDGIKVEITQHGTRHPLHGQGWRQPWHVVAAEVSSAILQFEGGGDEWPWRYRSRQKFDLSASGLSVWLEVENLSNTAMPASLGLHPYFPELRSASLRAPSSGMWETDAEVMPTCWAGPDISPSFQTFKKLAASDLDNCFTGFGGEAVIRWPNRPDVRILSQGCNFLQVYTRGEDGSFCVEAQTAMPDGINRIGNPNAGIVIVEPGQTFGCDTHFVVASAA